MRTVRRTCWALLLCIAVMLASLAVVLPAQAKNTKPHNKPTIIVGTNSEGYPPFEMVSPNGKLVGFDIDLVTAIAKRAGLKVEFRGYPWGELWDPGLVLPDPTLDMVAAAVTIWGPREDLVYFSNAYVTANQCLTAAATSPIASTDDLGPGDTIAVLHGAIAELWAMDNLPTGVAVRPYPYPALPPLPEVFGTFADALAAFADVSAGIVDGVIYPLPETQYILRDASLKVRIVQEINVGSYIGEPAEQYGFCFPKNPEGAALRETVNTALQQIKDDGTYLKIYRSWFRADPPSIP